VIKAFLIDDDPIQLRLAELLINRTAVFDQLQIFGGAEGALEFLQAAENRSDLPDIILLDLNMPETDGWMFLERFKGIIGDLDKEIRIFILSSSIDENEIARSRQYPFVAGFISKPINQDILKEIGSQFS
jgi:two-component system, chemotaxis family, chemotaxis protein CheY